MNKNNFVSHVSMMIVDHIQTSFYILIIVYVRRWGHVFDQILSFWTMQLSQVFDYGISLFSYDFYLSATIFFRAQLYEVVRSSGAYI